MLKNVRKKQREFIANPSIAQGRELLLTLGPALVVILAAFLLALRFMPPPPPKEVTILTGGQGGGYHAFGLRYAEVLKRSGVRLIVQPTAGSIENLQRLKSTDDKAVLGLLQGGIGDSQSAPDLLSLGRVFYEPLWVFYRGPTLTMLHEMERKRIAVGATGSGTRALAEKMLDASKITSSNATLLPLTGQPAVDALKKGEIDAVFLALAPQAPLIQDLLHAEGIKLMSFAQADAMTRLFPYLARVTLARGVIDLKADIPTQDVTLVAPRAALVARNTLHPAIIALMAEAAVEVHGKPSIFGGTGEFPTHADPEFEMDADALRYYKSGPTFWKRFLPYWLANMVERAIVFLVPLLTVLIPLVKILPAIYRWRFRQRLLHWYARLKDVEERVAELARTQPEETAELHAELDDIDQSVSRLPVPIQFAEQFYNMRTHLDLVRQRLNAKAA
jgi:TRAP-type uncharacterized transport system substrate-binding protein